MFGYISHKQATAPAIIGPEKEVPLETTTSSFSFTTKTFPPSAKVSGFTLLSAEGPKEEKPTIFSLASTAPTEMMFFASAGAVK